MGMAASQARYLALVARKSNCELEGQQINQARTALSNQSANLFNQMLGLQVPTPPSTQDFTKVQYSFTDGINASVMTDWYQLSGNDPDFNYVVTHYYNTDKYTGSMKKLSDPQVQTTGGPGGATNALMQSKLLAIEAAEAAYETAKANTIAKEEELKDLSTYENTTKYGSVTNSSYDSLLDQYKVGGDTFVSYAKATPAQQALIDTNIQALIDNGALTGSVSDYTGNIYVGGTPPVFAFKEDLDLLHGINSTNTATVLRCFDPGNGSAGEIEFEINRIKNELSDATTGLYKLEADALLALNAAKQDYLDLNVPTYIGNSELTPLSALTKDQEIEIKQVIADMKAQGISTELEKCFDANGNYLGGIFQFKMNGTTYYTTLTDLMNSYNSGTGNNNIDGQHKLNYYNASYVPTKIEKTEKALIETDGSGRFVSVRLENDTITYNLNMETITDEAAYEDAMNQYLYANAEYDKMIRDINAKTSIIHQQDQQLELRLKQLDTEQSALSTEMEAVKKVVDDNVESSFKTFNG